MKILLLSVLLSVLVSVMSTGFARNWRVGTNGLVRWDHDCDYNGNDITKHRASGEECGPLCFADPECTHFTHKDSEGICLLKSYYRPGWFEIHSNRDTCGWIPGRAYENRK